MPRRIRKTIKRAVRGLLILFIILFTFSACRSRQNSFDIHTFRSGQGWGYDIMAGGKVYIHQPYMPVFQGDVPFSSEKAAEKTGQLMVKKLKHHRVPSVTREELEKILRN
jgi:hypothetical protein